MNANNDAFHCLYQHLDPEQKRHVREQLCPSMTMKLVEKNRILIIALLLDLGAKFLLNDQLFNCKNFKENPTLQTLLYLNRFNVSSNDQTSSSSSSSPFFNNNNNSNNNGEKSLIKSMLFLPNRFKGNNTQQP
ncbi:hypothetical protein PPL_01773 [Heterostelium album PN500]|uniref:Uncharacterized protein n=1 Tax=Heterostelium pallidum (strain ATCC 26659 / Pp 5 / PN500) TaxID=670386 RepID=D3B0F7_HETP5|nr:hypothetical protein PPL_01773 [Heterostelium album PN500]EFA84781.1 hypothetical protein PPL_01773 [Heterostelium album PN500]|eukprot:XP_020436893.1 hypothetical protein PPL_01773 [Heterostelium album PN500]